jgi:hypothetical protein
VDRASIDLVLAERREALSDGGSDSPGSAAGPVVSADRAAAERLLARHRRGLARVTDPRRRRQRAYELLARNGFDPETSSEAVQRMFAAGNPPEPIE